MSTADATVRPRVLIGAYACGPGDEPEAAAGWAFAMAASVNHDVWIVTRRRFVDLLQRELDTDPALQARVTIVPLELSERLLAMKRGRGGVYWYYALWQRALRREADRLHAEIHFDIAHHVTFANDWMPCGLAKTEIPLVWGPVGGASRVPILKLRRWLGIRGALTEILRSLATGIPRAVWGDSAARTATVVVAQNPDVARRFRRASHVVTEPNAAFHLDGPPRDSSERPTALFVARLLAWKGGRLAVDAIADPRLRDWRLEVFGSGYERKHLEARAERAGVADRIVFHGHRPRNEVLAGYSRATALLFPSMHDQAGWAAAEASASGIPVVCLPLGGPPLLAERNAVVAPLQGNIVRNVADALLQAQRQGGEVHDRWSPDRLTALVDEWYSIAGARNR